MPPKTKKQVVTNSGATVTLNPFIKHSNKKNIIEPTEAEKLPLDIFKLEEYIDKLNPSDSLNISDIIQNVKNTKSLFNAYNNAIESKDEEQIKECIGWIHAFINNLDIFSLMSFLYVCETVKTNPYNKDKVIEEGSIYTFKNVIADMVNDKLMDFKIALDMKTFSLALANEQPKVSKIFWIQDEYVRILIKQSLVLYKAMFAGCMDIV